jgi:5-methylcytosine-specific restriction protein A
MRTEISNGMNSLSKADIELAINRLRQNEKHEFGDSTHYDCVVGAYHFPPKAVIGLALQAKSGKTIYPKDFKGGLESRCFKVLGKNGFHVVRKQNVTWLFQGNPEIFNIDAYLGETKYKYWSCPKFHKEIQTGDKAFFYRCGKGAAVIAKGTIVEVPVQREKVKHPELLSEYNKEKKITFKVGVNVEETRVLTPENTVSRYDLLQDDLLKENSLITSRQSSVFKLTEGQRNSLESLWLKRKTESRLIEAHNISSDEKGVVLASRKSFIQSLGATCKNWQWSWSFIHEEKKQIIFGAWDRQKTGQKVKIFSEEWEKSSRGKKNAGYQQSREHIRLIEEGKYKLMTFPMKYSDDRKDEHGVGPAKIESFEPILSENTLIKIGNSWYASRYEDEVVEPLAEELASDQKFKEGSRVSVTINAYERNGKARAACIKHYGFTCTVCEISLTKTYGRIADRFIHVHHVNPIGSKKEEYIIDPVKDLVTVCPNCHAMLHRVDPPLLVKDLKDILKVQMQKEPGYHEGVSR